MNETEQKSLATFLHALREQIAQAKPRGKVPEGSFIIWSAKTQRVEYLGQFKDKPVKLASEDLPLVRFYQQMWHNQELFINELARDQFRKYKESLPTITNVE